MTAYCVWEGIHGPFTAHAAYFVQLARPCGCDQSGDLAPACVACAAELRRLRESPNANVCQDCGQVNKPYLAAMSTILEGVLR